MKASISGEDTKNAKRKKSLDDGKGLVESSLAFTHLLAKGLEQPIFGNARLQDLTTWSFPGQDSSRSFYREVCGLQHLGLWGLLRHVGFN